MAAYASLLSLTHILDNILQHPPRQMPVLDKAQIDSLLEKVTFLQDFLEDFSLMRGDEIQALEAKIVSSAYAAEDIIESRVVDRILENSEAESESSSTLFSQDLQKVIEEFDSIKKDVTKIKETEGLKIMQQPRKAATSGSFVRGASNSKNAMVGFDEDLIQIMETLTGDESNLQIHSVVGMGGIGKTTLARNVFDNPLIVHHFDLHAWVTISQQYSVHEILLGLLKDIGVLAGGSEEISKKNDDELGLCLHKNLFDRSYLIVMDDMWSIDVWDGIKRFFPDNNNGSRVLVTTRLSNVADAFRSGTPHLLHFLDEEKSWTLFCDKVFADESCPHELEDVGKTIARNCGGLPLAIVAISGLLAKSSRTVEYWDNVANDTHTAVNMEGDGHCFEMLSLSYKHLPVHLKPCFLYMAIFPEDCKIRISRLVKLWVAEGILKPIRSRSLEEIAEDNLKDLIDRNLILIHKYGSSNKIKTCTIHDLLRELCIREAQKDNFLCVAMMHSLNNHPRSIINMRRLIIHRSSEEEESEEEEEESEEEEKESEEEEGESKESEEEESEEEEGESEEEEEEPEEGEEESGEKECQQQVFDAMNLASCTRSLICCELESKSIKLPVCFRLLRVLSMDDIYSCEEILRLVNSRYIEFEARLFPNLLNPLKSLSLLWNLQSITIAGTLNERPIDLPVEIWEMPLLRHIKREEGFFYLPRPPSTKSKNGSRDFFVLKNLQTLYKIMNFRCTDEVIHRIPNLKKLGVIYDVGVSWYYYEVNNLVHLCNLESLFLKYCGRDVFQNICFPHSLKKLTLSDCRVSWEDLTVVGSLPHLEVLKLIFKGVRGRVWNPVEGEFLELKSLQIERTDLVEWIADSSHFPRLENLALRFVGHLKEIPYGIGEIQTLRSISLEDCSDSANSSAKKIQEEQQNLGNYDLQVHVLVWDPRIRIHAQVVRAAVLFKKASRKARNSWRS